jgi:hypothetical protein
VEDGGGVFCALTLVLSILKKTCFHYILSLFLDLKEEHGVTSSLRLGVSTLMVGTGIMTVVERKG